MQIISTKVSVPPLRSRVVKRSRLIEKLNWGFEAGFLLVSAPAGYGKSTLLSAWVRQLEIPCAWLSLDENDNDLRRFLAYLVAALNGIDPSLGEDLEIFLQASPLPAVDALLTPLVNKLSLLAQPFCLVLDDYHLIQEQSVHQAITFLLEHRPTPMHLAIATRADPPLPLARMRARTEMMELRLVDLRFSTPEIDEFLCHGMGLNLSKADLDLLEANTEGWIAGLQMAGLSLQGREEPSSFIRSFSGENRYVLDFLFDEVFLRQAEAIQFFLLQTSILDRLCASLCSAVTLQDDSQAMLDILEHRNLFLIALDEQRTWYRYHNLFRDLLFSRLEKFYSEQVADLNQKASGWYEEQGLLVEAVRYALAGNDVDRVSHLAEKNVLGLMEHGNLYHLVTWLDELPSELIRSRPWLCIARAWAHLHISSSETTMACLDDATLAIQGPELAPNELTRIQGHIQAIRGSRIGSNYDDRCAAIQAGQAALAQLPESDWRVRGYVTVMLGLAYRLNMEYAPALQALSQALTIAKAARQGYVVVDLLCQIARVEFDQGKLHQSVITCREALQQANEYSGYNLSYLPVISYALCTLGYILVEWNELDAALDCAQQAMSLAKQWGVSDPISDAYWLVANILICRGELDRAMEIIQDRAKLNVSQSRNNRGVIAMEALTRLAMDDLTGASHLVNKLAADVAEDWRMERLIPVYLAEFRHGLRPSLEDVFNYIKRTLDLAEKVGYNYGVVSLLIQHAMAYQATNQAEQACATLVRAVTLAESEGYTRSFINYGAVMRELLVTILPTLQLHQDGSCKGIVKYVHRLLTALDAEKPARIPIVPPASSLFEPLSTRELEILHLLSKGLQDKQIAETLVISRETVHKHLKNIYEKLDVHSRTEAIARGRELGIL